MARLSGASGDVARHFAQFALERLPSATVAMLIRSSILKTLQPELCSMLSGLADCGKVLSALEQDTGLVTSVEGEEGIFRMHPLFGEFLRSRAEALPEPDLRDLHRTAARWYAARDMQCPAGRRGSVRAAGRFRLLL